jgi:hypothetical protein
MHRSSHTISKLAAVLLFFSLGSTMIAREVQEHGLWFEQWICDTFFDGYRPSRYTQKWDIPAEANTSHGHLPVNPKATKLGSPIGLGDALRQFDIIDGPDSFILIVGFWEQTTPATKSWVNTQAVTITPERWRTLWHPITLADLLRLDAVIKDTSLSLEEARKRAKKVKSERPFSEALIQINPKIDRSQRRLQCSLSFNAFFDHLLPGVSRVSQPSPTLWNRPIPDMHDTAARTFQR